MWRTTEVGEKGGERHQSWPAPSRWGRRQSRTPKGSKRGRGPRFPLHQRTGSFIEKEKHKKVSSRVCFGFSSVCLPIKSGRLGDSFAVFHSVKRIRGKAPTLFLDFRLRFATPGQAWTLRHLPERAPLGGARPAASAPPAGAGPRGWSRGWGVRGGRFPTRQVDSKPLPAQPSLPAPSRRRDLSFPETTLGVRWKSWINP